MNSTDACVYPYPNGDSSVRRLALEAKSLGYDSIVAAETPACEYQGVIVLSGLMIAGKPLKDVMSIIRRSRGSGSIVSVQVGDNGFNRAVLGMNDVHILRGIHAADKRAFDHVAAKIAADKRTALDIDLSPLISCRGHARQKAIHRYLDLIVLHQRYEFPLTISSCSRSVLSMRSVREVTGLCSLIGMDMVDVQQALSGISRVTEPGDVAVRVIS
ncbi:MAG: RNase P subunit p30 family protein [Methanoregula sp.]